MRRSHIWFALWHLAVIVPATAIFVATNGATLLELLAAIILIAAALYTIAFIRRDDRAMSGSHLLWRGALTTLLCLPIWFVVFLVLSWLTGDSVLLIGMVFVFPLSAVSSGLTAILALGPFSSQSRDQPLAS